MKLFNITLELLVETDIFWRAFNFFFRTYIEKGMKVRFLILVYGSPSTFHSWRENTEQLLTSVTLSVLAPLPGRKENICRVCLYALAGSVTLSFAFFSIFESFNTNRIGLSTGICLLQAVLTSTLVCQQRTLRWFASCLPAIAFQQRKVDVGSEEMRHADVFLGAGGGCRHTDLLNSGNAVQGSLCSLTLGSGFRCNVRV